MPHHAITLSIVIPVYNEGEGLDLLFDRLKVLLNELNEPAEVIFVDDHSADRSPEILKRACAETSGFRMLRLSRNSGSHVAVLAGLAHARGACAAFMAADLQDPPELLREMLEKWRHGSQVVWAVRAGREGIGLVERFFAAAFYWLLNRLGEVTLPPDGADFALMDRLVLDSLVRSAGANPSIVGELARIGFSQSAIPYVKGARQFGTTKWNLRKRLKAFADAFVSFSYAPMRAMSYLGLASSALGFLYAAFIFVAHFVTGRQVQGYASLMVVVLTLGGVQMIMLGVLGEYLWRTLDEARRRPLYFVEDSSEPATTERAALPPGPQP